jgi:S1-C subfamily serine protease
MQSMFVLSMVFILFFGFPASVLGKITNSIVKIYTTYDSPNYLRPWQMSGQRSRIGSGSIIEGRRILTNAHVVSDNTFIRVRRAGQADKFVATVEAISHELDLAILKVQNLAFFEGAKALKIGKLPRVGNKVFAYGFPRGGTRITITEGIVSRIERKLYSHSRFKNLVCQIDAAINPGSSGGPVISENKIAGVIFQSTSGQNIGYMVPAPIIRHFFKDLEDGSYDGVPTLFFVWQNLENPQMRKFLHMSQTQSGILVKQVSPAFMAEDMLLPGDVILSIEGFNVATDGTIVLRETERISFNYAVDHKQLNERITLEVLRRGRVLSLDIGLNVPRANYGYMIPRIKYETLPTYYIIGGLVFTQLTENYLNVWGKWRNIPIKLKNYYFEIVTTENQKRKDIIVLMDILPDEINVGYGHFKNWVVATVNGVKISSMKNLVEVFESHNGDYHQILLEQHNAEIILAKKHLKQKSQNILDKYKVNADRSSNLQTPK